MPRRRLKIDTPSPSLPPSGPVMSYPPMAPTPPALFRGASLDTDSEFEEISAPSEDETSASEILADSDSDEEAIHFTRQGELNKLLEQAQTSKQDADALRAVLDDLKKERDDAHRICRSLHETVSSLRNQLDSSLQERQEAASSHFVETTSLREEIKSLCLRNEDSVKRHDKTTAALRALESEMMTLRKASDEKYSMLRQDRDAKHMSFMDSEAALERVTFEKDAISKELSEKDAEVLRLERQMQILRLEKEKILRIAQSKSEKHYMEKKEAERVSMEKADVEQTLETFRAENQALSMKLDLESQQSSQRYCALTEEVESHKRKSHAVNEELDNLRRVDGDRRAMFSQLQKAHHHLRNSHDALQTEVEKLRNDLQIAVRQQDEGDKREAVLATDLKVTGKRLRDEQERRNETLLRLERLKQEKLMSERTMSSRISTLEREKADALMDAHKYKTRVKRLQMKV